MSAVMQPMRKAVSTGARRTIVTAAFENLGKAVRGHKDQERSDWATKTFLGNFKSMEPEVRAWAFRQTVSGAQYEQNLQEIARLADLIEGAMQPDADGSAKQATFHARTADALVRPILGDTAIGGRPLPRQVSQRLMLNPVFVNWLAKAPQIKPGQIKPYMRRLAESAAISGDKQLQQDVAEYINP